MTSSKAKTNWPELRISSTLLKNNTFLVVLPLSVLKKKESLETPEESMRNISSQSTSKSEPLFQSLENS